MQNGLIPTVNILYTGNDHLHAFMHRQNRTEFLCPEQLSTLACVNVWFYANRYWNTHGWCPLNLLQYSAVEHSVTPLLFCSVKFTLNLESITTVLIYIYIYICIFIQLVTSSCAASHFMSLLLQLPTHMSICLYTVLSYIPWVYRITA